MRTQRDEKNWLDDVFLDETLMIEAENAPIPDLIEFLTGLNSYTGSTRVDVVAQISYPRRNIRFADSLHAGMDMNMPHYAYAAYEYGDPMMKSPERVTTTLTYAKKSTMKRKPRPPRVARKRSDWRTLRPIPSAVVDMPSVPEDVRKKKKKKMKNKTRQGRMRMIRIKHGEARLRETRLGLASKRRYMAQKQSATQGRGKMRHFELPWSKMKKKEMCSEAADMLLSSLVPE